MKVLAIMGSPHRGNSLQATQRILAVRPGDPGHGLDDGSPDRSCHRRICGIDNQKEE